MNEIKYSFQLEQLLKDEAEIAESLSVLHRMSYVRYNTFSSIVSIPIIVISSMTGYMTALDLGWKNSSVILGSLIILVGIIRGIEAYFVGANAARATESAAYSTPKPVSFTNLGR